MGELEFREGWLFLKKVQSVGWNLCDVRVSLDCIALAGQGWQVGEFAVSFQNSLFGWEK